MRVVPGAQTSPAPSSAGVSAGRGAPDGSSGTSTGALVWESVQAISPARVTWEPVGEEPQDVKGSREAGGLREDAPFLSLPGCPSAPGTSLSEPPQEAVPMLMRPCRHVQGATQFGVFGEVFPV